MERNFTLEKYGIEGDIHTLDRAIDYVEQSEIGEKLFVLNILNAVRKEHIYTTGQGLNRLSKEDFCKNIGTIANNSPEIRNRLVKCLALAIGESPEEFYFDSANSVYFLGKSYEYTMSVMCYYKDTDISRAAYVTYDELFGKSK